MSDNDTTAPKAPSTTTITARVPCTLKQQFHEAAEAIGLKESQVVAALVERFVQRRTLEDNTTSVASERLELAKNLIFKLYGCMIGSKLYDPEEVLLQLALSDLWEDAP